MLAIIPARGGSKGLPGKNIMELGGKPLIHWTIEAALKATSISKLILSTNDQKIADICKPTGIEIPFMRPDELAKDDSLAIDNYIYTVERLNQDFNWDIQDFAVLLPTTPFRNESDIEQAIEIFCSKNADSVISCTPLPYPDDWVLNVNSHSRIINNTNVDRLSNRQKLSSSYIPNGGIYILKYDIIKKKYTYYTDNTYAYIMPPERSIDIDNKFDFTFAEFMVAKNQTNA